MTARRLVFIAVLAILAVSGASWLASHRALERTTPDSALYPGLKETLDKADRVLIYARKDEPAVTLARGAQGWTVAERGGYPVDAVKLRTLLRNLGEARLVEAKTSVADRYAQLGVEDPKTDKATNVRVVVNGVTPAADLIVGKEAAGRGTYVRRQGEAESWLVTPTLSASSDPAQWIDRNLLDIKADRIAAVTAGGGDAAYTAVKSTRADADFTVTGVPKGRELSSPGAANGFATALANVSANDVKPAAELADTPPADHAVFTTFDGLHIEPTGYRTGDQRYVTVAVQLDEALAQRYFVAPAPSTPATAEQSPVAPDDAQPAAQDTTTAAPPEQSATEAGEAPDKGAAADAFASALAKTREEADELTGRTRGWAYQIPTYTYDAIFRPLNDLLAPLPEKKKK